MAELLTTIDVARVLGVSEKTVRNYTYRIDQPLKHRSTVHGMTRTLYYERTDVDAFAEKFGLKVDWSRL